MKIVLSNGMTHQFDGDADAAEKLVDWFKSAQADHVATLSVPRFTWHIQKRHIVHIEVPHQ